MKLRGRLLALFLVLGSTAAFAQATPPASLSPDLLNAAIAAAKAPTPPAPYVLKGPSTPVTRGAPLDPEVAKTLDPNKILTFGAVYTPLVRAAILARKAADAGKPFGPVLLNLNSFLLGSRQTNPHASVRVFFTGDWEDDAHDAAATNALVSRAPQPNHAIRSMSVAADPSPIATNASGERGAKPRRRPSRNSFTERSC